MEGEPRIRRPDSPTPRGHQNDLNVIARRAKIQGFILYVPSLSAPQFVRLTLHFLLSSPDSAWQFPRAADLVAGLADGTINHIVEGLENASTALPMLISGDNSGKL